MLMKRFTRPFRQLRGKLTLSYTLTSVVTFLLIEVMLITIVLSFASLNISSITLSNLKQEAPQAAPYFVHGSPDSEELTSWLHIITTDAPNQGTLNQYHPIFLSVIDTQGQTVASIGTRPIPLNTPIQAQLSPQSRADLFAVLHDVKGTTSKVSQDADGARVAITPIVGNGGTLQGALVMKTTQAFLPILLSGFLQLILVSVIIVTTIAAVVGMVSGYLTSRGLKRRLTRLSTASNRWSRGDFSMPTDDVSEDELGQVSRQLNRMAEQLQNLLQVRQKLATLEERNRLARDLHDSVKQQVFAISMQIAATKVLLKRDAGAAELRLHETEKLVRQVQQELTSLIRELRPAALEGKGLADALRELATQWTQQSDIVANLRVEGAQETQGTHGIEGIQTLPLSVEEALFRVAQESLANAARHSKATLVQMTLTTTDDSVTLTVVDNGQGFDTTRQGRPGVGLLSMQERMKALGGDAQVESTPGKGTRIVAYCKRSGVGTSDATNELKDENEEHTEHTKDSALGTFRRVERI